MEEEREGGALERVTHTTEDIFSGIIGRVGAAMTDRAEDFVQSAAVSDMYEIEAGRLAFRRARSSAVRDAARQMVDDHVESNIQLEGALRQDLRHAVPSALDKRRKAMLEHLRQTGEKDFDKTYVDQQIMAHKEAIALMHHFRENGDNDALRRYAAEISPIIEGHLETMNELAEGK